MREAHDKTPQRPEYKNGRGRPRKAGVFQEDRILKPEAKITQKRGRGRPKKRPYHPRKVWKEPQPVTVREPGYSELLEYSKTAVSSADLTARQIDLMIARKVDLLDPKIFEGECGSEQGEDE